MYIVPYKLKSKKNLDYLLREEPISLKEGNHTLFFFITGRICGDKCIYSGKEHTCSCGNDGNFDETDGYYCCIPKNVTCTVNNGNVMCPEGKKLPWNTLCQDHRQCPINTYSQTAVSSNCSDVRKNHCPSTEDASKICLNDDQLEIEDYVDIEDLDIEDYCYKGKACTKAIMGLEYKQCNNP